jgi:hypothetical protein
MFFGDTSSFDDTSLRAILSMGYWNYVTIIHSLFYIARIDWNLVLEEPIFIHDLVRLQSAAEPKRILIAALIIAWKVTHDGGWSNDKIQDFTRQQILETELVFLRVIDFNLNLQEEAFSSFKNTIIVKTIYDFFDLCNIIVY